MESLEFILVANGPGELSALVKPIVEKLRERSSKKVPIRTTLFLTPCQFSSGKEEQFVKTLGLDQVVTAEEYRKWILGMALNRDLKLKYRGVVLYLGGDLLHAVLIAKKLGYKVYAYLHGQKAGWKSVFSKFFVQNEKSERELVKAGIKPERIQIAGDLMLNSINPLPKSTAIEKWKLSSKKPIIAFLPGSRGWEIDFMVPFYETIGMELKQIIPGIQLIMIVSPFTSIEEVEIKLKDNVFDLLAPLNSVSAADLAVTIPGTNTAQIATAGIPLLSLFPINQIKDIPLEGFLNYLTKVPLLGAAIKRLVAEITIKRNKFFAIPNIKAKKMIHPELNGNLTPEQVVEKIISILNNQDQLKEMEKQLKKIMGESNAADIITREIINENIPAPV
ncbi:hypothetical protein ACFL52_03210 [Candidatus Margulisiibacteriota bacterium]